MLPFLNSFFKNYDNFLGELDVMQKADRERRQKELLNIPVSDLQLHATRFEMKINLF